MNALQVPRRQQVHVCLCVSSASWYVMNINNITVNVGNPVGGSLWRGVYSNDSILEPFMVFVWAGGPAIVYQTHWWFNPHGTFYKEEELSLESGTCQPSAACSRHLAELSVTNHVYGVMDAMWCVIQVVFWLGWTATVRPEPWVVWEEVWTKSSLTPRCGVSSPHTASRGRLLRHRLSEQHLSAWACCYFRQWWRDISIYILHKQKQQQIWGINSRTMMQKGSE